MQYVLDTGILLRLMNREAVEHASVRQVIRNLKLQGHSVVTTFQNVCEFWNVCTRPAEARGGLGLSAEETQRRLRTVERIASIVPDSPAAYACWRDLVLKHGVKRVQVHDAKLVALMSVSGLNSLLTLNPRDFARYAAITVLTPADLANERS
jgi:predicted nucleic acid-binding protein